MPNSVCKSAISLAEIQLFDEVDGVVGFFGGGTVPVEEGITTVHETAHEETVHEALGSSRKDWSLKSSSSSPESSCSHQVSSIKIPVASSIVHVVDTEISTVHVRRKFVPKVELENDLRS